MKLMVRQSRWDSTGRNLFGVIAYVAALALAFAPAQLPRSAGWHVGAAHVTPGCVRCVQTESWASTIRYRDQPQALPQRTIRALPRTGVIVWVTRSRQPSPPAWMLRSRTLRIVRSAIHGNFEGNLTNGRVSQWFASTWRSGSFVTAYVFFGSPSPPQALIADAQRELDAMRLPRWPR